MIEENRNNGNPYPERNRVWTPYREWAADTWVVVIPFSPGVGMEEVVVDIYSVEGQVEAVVAVGPDCPGRIASHSMVAGSVLPVALRFPLFDSKKCSELAPDKLKHVPIGMVWRTLAGLAVC